MNSRDGLICFESAGMLPRLFVCTRLSELKTRATAIQGLDSFRVCPLVVETTRDVCLCVLQPGLESFMYGYPY